MTNFVSLNLDTAPDAAKPMLNGVQDRFGFIPDIYAKMSIAPAAVEGYLALAAIFERSGFSAQEQQVILLAVSLENRCEYCVAAHSMIARQRVQIDPAMVTALRAGDKGPDVKLQALADFTRAVVRERGFVPQAAIDHFLAAGYAQPQILDVILGVSIKTLSNYCNHITQPEVDEPFQADAWQAPARPM